MIRKISQSILILIAMQPILSIAVYAQSQILQTRHVRQVTQDGEAQFLGTVPANQSMRLVLILPLRNQAELRGFLTRLYDPSNPAYRHFLTVDQFAQEFGPTQEDYDRVIAFAHENGFEVVGMSRNRMNIDVAGSVANIEAAFHLTMGVYQHPTENRTFYAPDREPTPDLAVQLWHITGLDNYSLPRPALSHQDLQIHQEATTGSCPSKSFCGSDMRAAYYGGTTLTGAGQSLGLLEYVGTDLADLTTYYTNAHQTNNVPITLLSVDGTPTTCYASQDCDDTEQTLDLTQALGMAPGLSSLVMYIGSSDAALLNAMATAKPLNAQLSASWVWGPSDPQTDDPYFEEFAAQGQNYFNAAGDWGEWSQTLLNEGAIYPADDVYVTSVGGTDLTTSSAGGPWSSETVWSDTGGGISPDDFAIPSWQVATAGGCSECSQNYRNGPDVAANSNFTFYVCADQTTCTANEYGGTSFAAPMWAGYMALVNQQAVANGGTALGFINPTLYSLGLSSGYSGDFHDISSGCQESGGFCATAGYDLATGWGSPNGAGLINALTAPAFNLSASPASLDVALGYAGKSTITTTAINGFKASISLSASGQPAGVTITFNPTSITGAGTSTMTASVSPTAALGTYTITVKGTSGSVVETTAVALKVVQGPHLHIGHGPY